MIIGKIDKRVDVLLLDATEIGREVMDHTEQVGSPFIVHLALGVLITLRILVALRIHINVHVAVGISIGIRFVVGAIFHLNVLVANLGLDRFAHLWRNCSPGGHGSGRGPLRR